MTDGRKSTGVLVFPVKMAGFVYITILLLLAVPSAFGYRRYAVTSGSMVPELPVGGCIYVRHEASEKICEGDIITYRLKDSDAVVTHRVTERMKYGGSEVCFRTKGDANSKPDAGTVSYRQILGTVRFCIPFAGYFLMAQNSRYVKLGELSLLLAVLLTDGFLRERATVKSGMAGKKKKSGMAGKKKKYSKG